MGSGRQGGRASFAFLGLDCWHANALLKRKDSFRGAVGMHSIRPLQMHVQELQIHVRAGLGLTGAVAALPDLHLAARVLALPHPPAGACSR